MMCCAGFIPTAYLNSASSFKVLTHEKAIRKERGACNKMLPPYTFAVLLCPARTVCSFMLRAYAVLVPKPKQGHARGPALNPNQSCVPDLDSTADIAVVAESRQCLIPVPKTKLHSEQHMTSMHA